MNKGIIELNDASIGLGLNGTLVDRSAGFAVLDQKNLMVGKNAQENIKLLPRWTNNRFWYQLNTDGLNNATGAVRHHADLAFAHLEHLSKSLTCDEVIIAVPGHYDKTQLGLLLGMCKEAGLPVRALVDLGLLSIARQPSHSTAMFLDISLHNISLSTFQTDGVLRQTGHHTLLETGLATYWDRWASIIAEQFIQSSRYDPMHEAASEQKLFNALPGFLDNVSANRALNFDLNLGSVTHSTVMSKDQLLAATSSAYPTIVQGVRQHVQQGEKFSLFVSPRLQNFPELMTSLNLIPNADVIHLPDTQIIENTEELWSSIVTNQGSVAHVTTLNIGTEPRKVSAAVATHLLVGDFAYPLRSVRNLSGFNGSLEQEPGSASVARSGEDYVLRIESADFSVNGQTGLTSHTLAVGDELQIQGHSARIVAER